MSTEKKQAIRLGSGKKINETFLSSSLCITDALEHSYEYNGKRYVKVNINIYAEPDQYGKNVKITLNDFEPSKKAESVNINSKSDLPF
jgi:hypothetical protein